MWNCRSALIALALFVGLAVSGGQTRLRAQETEEKLSLHGYLTQAYGKSDKLPINGVPKDGTWDYRVMALQMRYDLTETDQFVVQVRNRRLGVGPINDEDIALDWAYYTHKFGSYKFGSAAVKVGRVPFSLGLYNELRLVGTVLPFFRAPSVFYIPGVETVDGVSITHQLPLKEWGLESIWYWGGNTSLTPVVLPTGTIVLKDRAENIYGAQEWLNTPIQGLRLGGAFHRFKAPNPTGSDTTGNNLYAASLDGTFERFFVRGEYMKYTAAKVLPGNLDVTYKNSYGQGGVKLIDQLPLWLNLQMEVSQADFGGAKYRATDDRAVGVSYMFDPNLVLKIEGHTAKGYTFDTYVAPNGPPGKTHYGIASLSVSF